VDVQDRLPPEELMMTVMASRTGDAIQARSETKARLEAQFRQFLDPAYIISDSESQKPFECDGLTIYREMPLLVVLPKTVEQVQRIMRICHELQVPVIARGAGTGLCAGATPSNDAVLLSMSRFDEIVAIDADARQARVQPGVRNLAISEAAAGYGLFYGPDPSSQIACSIGGNVAENSGGVHCLKYGLTVHNVLRIEMVDVTGERIVIGGEALDAPGFDLLALAIGSEGLLGIVTEVTVKLLPAPELARVVLAAFASVQAAGDAVGAVIAEGIIPGGLEMMDGNAIRAAEDFARAGYPRDAAALLLCEIDGTAVETDAECARVAELFTRLGATLVRISQTEQERALLWKGRKSAFPAVGRIAADYYCMDGTIPRSQLAAVLTEIDRLSQEYGLGVANVFHAGDGNLHPLILFDAARPGDTEKAEAFGGKILELCVAVGGCITGEHGVGLEKIRQMPAQFSVEEIMQFHAIKAAFDPYCRLNPGKGIPLLRNCQEYRSLEAPRGALE
jgi:glycolate oxidase